MFLRFLASEYQLLERDDTAFRNKPNDRFQDTKTQNCKSDRRKIRRFR